MLRSRANKIRTALLIAAPLGCLSFCRPAQADPLFALLGAEGLRLFHQSKRFKSLNSGAIIRQTSDVTCGPAALASLLHFYFGDTATEEEMAKLSGTYEKGTSTLLGLRNACRSKGYEAVGYRMTLPQLLDEVDSSGVPVLVHFKTPSLHYALVLGQVDNFILVSDPSQGNLSMDVADFLRRWDGMALVVTSSRPADRTVIEKRKQSAATRIETLNRTSSLMSSLRF